MTPKLPTDGIAADDSPLQFPTRFPIKAMGKMKANGSADFAEIVVAIVLKHAPDFDPSTLEMRPSRQANYLSVTATINATSRQQLDNLYRELVAHPLVLMAL